MKFCKRTVFALLLVAVILCTLVGCTPANNGYPEYEDNKSMWIGGWDVPMNTLEDYQMAKDMGLTHMFIDNMFAKKGTEEYAQQLRYCEQAGLKAIVGMDTSLNNVDNVKLDTTDYSIYPAVDMINVWDEPYSSKFDEVAEWVDRLNEIYKGEMTLFINQTPMSNKDDKAFEESTEAFLELAYTKFLSKLNGRKIFSTDIYPLLEAYGEYALDTSWLHKMEVYANYAKQYRNEGGEFHMFIQTYSADKNRDILSKQDISFQVYTDMAFGINGFTYFTYRKSFLGGFGGGCVENDVSCTPTETYYWAKELNAEIAKFDHVYLSFDWEGVMGVNGTNNYEIDPEYVNDSFDLLSAPLTALNGVKNVTATEDTLIGQFKDKDGRAGFIVTNFTEPTNLLKDTVTFEFNKANRAIVYRNGERQIYEVKKNKLELNLGAGEGVFIIPVSI